MVSQGVSLLWSSFIGKKKVRSAGCFCRCSHVIVSVADSLSFAQSEERLPMRFSALVEHVTKKPVPAHVTHFVVEVMASDEDGEDVEVRIPNCFSRPLFPIPTVCAGPLHRGTKVSLWQGEGTCERNNSFVIVAISRRLSRLCIVNFVSHGVPVDGESHAC